MTLNGNGVKYQSRQNRRMPIEAGMRMALKRFKKIYFTNKSFRVVGTGFGGPAQSPMKPRDKSRMERRKKRRKKDFICKIWAVIPPSWRNTLANAAGQ